MPLYNSKCKQKATQKEVLPFMLAKPVVSVHCYNSLLVIIHITNHFLSVYFKTIASIISCSRIIQVMIQYTYSILKLVSQNFETKKLTFRKTINSIPWKPTNKFLLVPCSIIIRETSF